MMLKKIFLVLFLSIYLFTFFSLDFQPAYAFFSQSDIFQGTDGGLTLWFTGAALSGLVLTGSNVTSAYEDFKNQVGPSAAQAWENAGRSAKTFKDTITGKTKTVITATPSMINDLKTWLASGYNSASGAGTKSITVPTGTQIDSTTYNSTLVSQGVNPYLPTSIDYTKPQIIKGANFTFKSNLVYSTITNKSRRIYCTITYLDALGVSHTEWFNLQSVFGYLGGTAEDVFARLSTEFNYLYFKFVKNTDGTLNVLCFYMKEIFTGVTYLRLDTGGAGAGYTTSYPVKNLTADFSGTTAQEFTLDYVYNPSLDVLTTKTEGADIIIPDSEAILNNTLANQGSNSLIYTPSATDVIVDNPDVTVPGVGTGVTSNLFTNTLANVQTALNSISSAISGFFDLTKPVNLDPLKVAGSTFTNKFPFSLPWDLLRGFQGLSLSGDVNFDISISKTKLLPAHIYRVDMSQFSPLLNTVRYVEIILFDIALILSTRKLLGGDV